MKLHDIVKESRKAILDILRDVRDSINEHQRQEGKTPEAETLLHDMQETANQIGLMSFVLMSQANGYENRSKPITPANPQDKPYSVGYRTGRDTAAEDIDKEAREVHDKVYKQYGTSINMSMAKKHLAESMLHELEHEDAAIMVEFGMPDNYTNKEEGLYKRGFRAGYVAYLKNTDHYPLR